MHRMAPIKTAAAAATITIEKERNVSMSEYYTFQNSNPSKFGFI